MRHVKKSCNNPCRFFLHQTVLGPISKNIRTTKLFMCVYIILLILMILLCVYVYYSIVHETVVKASRRILASYHNSMQKNFLERFLHSCCTCFCMFSLSATPRLRPSFERSVGSSPFAEINFEVGDCTRRLKWKMISTGSQLCFGGPWY